MIESDLIEYQHQVKGSGSKAQQQTVDKEKELKKLIENEESLVTTSNKQVEEAHQQLVKSITDLIQMRLYTQIAGEQKKADGMSGVKGLAGVSYNADASGVEKSVEGALTTQLIQMRN